MPKKAAVAIKAKKSKAVGNSAAHKITLDRERLLAAMQHSAVRMQNRYGGRLLTIYTNQVRVDLSFPEMMDKIMKDENEQWLSVANDSYMVSYCKKKEDKLLVSKRTKTTMVKYLTRQMNIYPNNFLSMFSENVWGQYYLNGPYPKVKVLKGPSITDFYASPGRGGSSCMTGAHSIKTMIYSINPEKVSLVVMDELRALLWTTDDGKKILDRIYPTGHWKIPIFRNWALSEGYLVRDNNNTFNSRDIPISDGSIHSITLKKWKSPLTKKVIYPYLDTFSFAESLGNETITLKNSCKDAKYKFINTDGTASEILFCAKCKRSNGPNEVYTLSLCRGCYDNFY